MKYLALALTLFPSLAFAEVSVVDGDTLDLDGVRYRINGIDAPEAAQKCQTAGGQSWYCGKRATEALETLVRGRRVTCTSLATDGYGREIGRCTANGADLAGAMVEQGMAWAFLKFSDEYAPAQARAKLAKRGVWQGQAQPAWEFREIKWSGASDKAPKGCPIKGNISQFGQIYHMPWSRWYNRTKINLAKGERWFCDEAEAVEAGWRPVKSK